MVFIYIKNGKTNLCHQNKRSPQQLYSSNTDSNMVRPLVVLVEVEVVASGTPLLGARGSCGVKQYTEKEEEMVIFYSLPSSFVLTS